LTDFSDGFHADRHQLPFGIRGLPEEGISGDFHAGLEAGRIALNLKQGAMHP